MFARAVAEKVDPAPSKSPAEGALSAVTPVLSKAAASDP
jgi:hypothetical protein